MANIQFLIFIASFLFFLGTIIKRSRNKTKLNLPPGPRALPLIGHLHLLGRKPHQSLHDLSVRYGPLVYISIGSIRSIIASSPEIVKEILKDKESVFLNRPQSANFDYLTYGSRDLGTIHYGDEWKFMKNFCMAELLGTRTLDSLLPIRQAELRVFMKLLLDKFQAKEAVNLGAELMRTTNNTISKMMLSTRCSAENDEAEEVRKFVTEFSELSAMLNLSETLWFCKGFDFQGFEKRREDARARYDEMIERIIREHQEARRKRKEMGDAADGGRIKDMLDILLDLYEDKNAERELTRDGMKAFVIGILIAGTDTSSVTLEWALAELINNPHIMEKARKEIDSVVGKDRLVEESDMHKLSYLEAIIKETLRLHPAGPLFLRESTEACTVSGYTIPAQTRLFVNVWSLGRDPKCWENPLEFRPERFLSGKEWGLKSNMLDVRGQYFQLLPFGRGRRSCPGASFALKFIPVVLAAMIQCFDWKVGDGEKNSKVNMEEGTALSLPMANPFICHVVPRVTPFLST